MPSLCNAFQIRDQIGDFDLIVNGLSPPVADYQTPDDVGLGEDYTASFVWLVPRSEGATLPPSLPRCAAAVPAPTVTYDERSVAPAPIAGGVSIRLILQQSSAASRELVWPLTARFAELRTDIGEGRVMTTEPPRRILLHNDTPTSLRLTAGDELLATFAPVGDRYAYATLSEPTHCETNYSIAGCPFGM